MSKDVGGRPTVMTPFVIQKLEQAFMMGATDLQACLVAGISDSAFYEYQEKTEGYKERKAKLKDQPNILAKMVVLNAVKDGDKNQANWLLERRDKDFVKKSEQKNQTELNIKGLSMEEAMDMDIEELQKADNVDDWLESLTNIDLSLDEL